MNQYTTRLWSALLSLSLLLSLAACSKDTTAATMHLKRTEGTVTVSDDAEKDVPLLENLGLYSGYGVDTRMESYAWISLDDVKLTKMDQESEIAIQKEGKALDIEIISGSLFFNVTQPLEDDETMNIRTSTMLIGIRGTCGWVENQDGHSRVYLLEGTVECSAGNQTVQVNAGEMAELMSDGTLVVQPFTVRDIQTFIQVELAQDPDLCSDIYDASGLEVLGFTDGEGDAGQDFGDDILAALENAKDGDVITLDKDYAQTAESFISMRGGSADNPVVLDLNGHTLKLSVWDMTIYGALQIRDSSTGDGMLDLGVTPISLSNSAYLFLDGGVISYGLSTRDDATFVMNGGMIERSVHVDGNSTFTMNGGTIGGTIESGDVVTNVDNNVFIHGNSTFTMNGGTIDSVEVDESSTFTMNGGTIAFVEVDDNSTFTMYSGTINFDVDTTGDSTFTMYDGTISRYVLMYGDSTFIMNGGKVLLVEGQEASTFIHNGGEVTQ